MQQNKSPVNVLQLLNSDNAYRKLLKVHNTNIRCKTPGKKTSHNGFDIKFPNLNIVIIEFQNTTFNETFTTMTFTYLAYVFLIT